MKKLFLLILFLALCVPVYGQMTTGAFSDIDTKWTSSGNDIYRTNGNVGIGTSAPEVELDVDGTIYTDIVISEWTLESNVNTACNTICVEDTLFAWDDGADTFVAEDSADADKCQCAGDNTKFVFYNGRQVHYNSKKLKY